MNVKTKEYNTSFLLSKKGQSLIEVLVAFSIFIVAITTISFLVLDSFIAMRQGGERTEAQFLAEEGLEAARSIRNADFDNLIAGVHGLDLSGGVWRFSGSEDTTGAFARTITVTDIDIDTKRIDSAITWQFSAFRQSSIVLSTYLTDWKQTHGSAAFLNVNTGDARLAGKSRKELIGVTLENIGTTDITIDTITLSWDNNKFIEEIVIDGVAVWSKDGPGTPTGRQRSGTELDIQDFILQFGSGSVNIDHFLFNGNMSGASFVARFAMSDGSTKFVRLEPQ